MRDLENELRATLERKADEASSVAKSTIPPQIVRRVRRREARTTILAGVTLAALVLSSVFGIRAFLEPETLVRPLEPAGDPFTVPDPPIALGDGSFLLASGNSAGEAWELVALEEDRGLALEVRTATGTSGTGGFTVPEQRSLEVSQHTFARPPNIERVIFGAAVPEAAGVRVDFSEGGTTPGRVFPLPTPFHEDLKIVLIQVRAEGEGEIVLTDSEGREITREQYLLIPPPKGPPPIPQLTPPFRPDEPIPQLDHFGNTVGHVPWKHAFGDPSGPPGALEEGFPWVTPGLPGVTAERIRKTASVGLTDVQPLVKAWWNSRPEISAPDNDFLEWWASYPVTEKLPGA